jgi:hypothetical protein
MIRLEGRMVPKCIAAEVRPNHVQHGPRSASQQWDDGMHAGSVHANSPTLATRERAQPKNRYVTAIAASTPTSSENSAQPSAWRVFFTPTEPKYTAST